MSKFNVAVIGATGYGGAEIVRLLGSHPNANVRTVTSGRLAGKPLREECPWLSSELILSSFEPETVDADFVFLCQETGFAMQHAAALIEKTRVIDLSADFRIKDVAVYEKYYNREHSAPELLSQAVYGLPELSDHAAIAQTRLLANPGCYPTATSLALAPFVKQGIINGTPVVDAKSGASGAGRSRKETDYLFAELTTGFKAYAVNGHRHTPEIELTAGRPVRFTPHLIPAARGIHSTVHVPISGSWTKAQIVDLFRSFYEGAAFVRIQNAWPTTKQVQGSNRCDLAVDYDEHTGYAIVCSVIDNLVKGAAGQAIQNMNIMAGLPETTALPLDGVWP